VRMYPSQYGVNCKLDKSETKQGTYYGDPFVLAALIKSEGYDQMSVQVDPQYGVSLFLGHRKKKENHPQG